MVVTMWKWYVFQHRATMTIDKLPSRVVRDVSPRQGTPSSVHSKGRFWSECLQEVSNAFPPHVYPFLQRARLPDA